MKEVSEVSKKC